MTRPSHSCRVQQNMEHKRTAATERAGASEWVATGGAEPRGPAVWLGSSRSPAVATGVALAAEGAAAVSGSGSKAVPGGKEAPKVGTTGRVGSCTGCAVLGVLPPGGWPPGPRCSALVRWPRRVKSAPSRAGRAPRGGGRSLDRGGARCGTDLCWRFALGPHRLRRGACGQRPQHCAAWPSLHPARHTVTGSPSLRCLQGRLHRRRGAALPQA